MVIEGHFSHVNFDSLSQHLSWCRNSNTGCHMQKILSWQDTFSASPDFTLSLAISKCSMIEIHFLYIRWHCWLFIEWHGVCLKTIFVHLWLYFMQKLPWRQDISLWLCGGDVKAFNYDLWHKSVNSNGLALYVLYVNTLVMPWYVLTGGIN